MIKSFELSAVRTRVTEILRPRTKWGRTTLWSGGLSMFLIAMRWITGSASGSNLSVWATFVTLVFAFCALRLSFRWAWRKFMWRLSHRLIVTYIFIGVIPILLLLLIMSLGSYLFAEQFATYIAISEYNLLGYSLRNVQKYKEAEAAFRKYIELIPNVFGSSPMSRWVVENCD